MRPGPTNPRVTLTFRYSYIIFARPNIHNRSRCVYTSIGTIESMRTRPLQPETLARAIHYLTR